MLLGMQAELHDTLCLFSATLLHRPHLGNEGCIQGRREIASVRLLTVHLTGVERVFPRKSDWILSGGVFDSFNQLVEEVPDQSGLGRGRSGVSWIALGVQIAYRRTEFVEESNWSTLANVCIARVQASRTWKAEQPRSRVQSFSL